LAWCYQDRRQPPRPGLKEWGAARSDYGKHYVRRVNMASFRVRTPAEYLRMLWRRKFFVLVPTIIVTITLAYVIYRLPDVYASEAMILVEQSKINGAVVTQATQIDITSRLGTIRNLVTSRTGLKEIIDNFGLYRELKVLNTPEEVVLDEMRRHIDIQVKNTGAGANAFTINFRGADPETVKNVTANLATRFIDSNTDIQVIESKRVMDQMEERLTQHKKQLEETEARKAEMQARNPEAFEGNDKTLQGQINSLQLQRQSMQTSIDSAKNNVVMMEQMLATINSNDFSQGDPLRSLAAGQTEAALRAKKAEYSAKLMQLLKIYKEKHPEVQEVRAQIEAVEKQIEDAKVEDKQQRAEDQEDLQKRRAAARGPEIESLKLRIAASKREVDIKQNELNQLQAEINRLNSKVEMIPSLQAAVQKIERDYNTTKKSYDELLVQKNNTDWSSKLMSELSGNTFRLQDPAYLPSKPVAPTRWLLYVLSMLLGFASGLVVALAIEARSFFTIQDARDVEHYMHLPLLVTVPQIITDNERRQRAMLRLVQFAGVLLLILVSIPVLVTIVQRSRMLNIFAGAY
jgi:polysaccharide biosynthesis transport protein